MNCLSRMVACLSFVALMAAIAGCDGQGAGLASVKGTVTYQGRPLEEGRIVFQPPQGRPSSGAIKAGQIVEVTTFKLGDGAPAGPVKVAIQATKPDPKDPTGMATISLLPTKYADPASSGLTATLERGKPNELTFSLSD
jgi:hypothetical protein